MRSWWIWWICFLWWEDQLVPKVLGDISASSMMGTSWFQLVFEIFQIKFGNIWWVMIHIVWLEKSVSFVKSCLICRLVMMLIALGNFWPYLQLSKLFQLSQISNFSSSSYSSVNPTRSLFELSERFQSNSIIKELEEPSEPKASEEWEIWESWVRWKSWRNWRCERAQRAGRCPVSSPPL